MWPTYPAYLSAEYAGRDMGMGMVRYGVSGTTTNSLSCAHGQNTRPRSPMVGGHPKGQGVARKRNSQATCYALNTHPTRNAPHAWAGACTAALERAPRAPAKGGVARSR